MGVGMNSSKHSHVTGQQTRQHDVCCHDLPVMILHVMSSATCWVPLLRVCISSNSSEHFTCTENQLTMMLIPAGYAPDAL